jgi:hypothetical protein
MYVSTQQSGQRLEESNRQNQFLPPRHIKSSENAEPVFRPSQPVQSLQRMSCFISSCRCPSRHAWWPENCSTTGATGGSPTWIHDSQYSVCSISRQLPGNVQADEDFLLDNSASLGSTMKETPCINKTKHFFP